jgi:hypothetical protein
MVNTVMLSSLRTKLDEASASFWTDVECYRALSDGQLEVTSILPYQMLAKNIIQATLTSGSIVGTTYEIARPTDVLRLLNALFNDIPARLILNDKEQLKSNTNTFMLPTVADPTMYEKDNLYVFEPSDASDTVIVDYVPILADIDASTSSTLIETSHPSIVQYAFSDLLKKSDRIQESTNEFGLFTTMIGAVK